MGIAVDTRLNTLFLDNDKEYNFIETYTETNLRIENEDLDKDDIILIYCYIYI